MSGNRGDRDDPGFNATTPNIRINKRHRPEPEEEQPEDYGATRPLDNVRVNQRPVADDRRDENVDFGATRPLSPRDASRGESAGRSASSSRARISQRRHEPAHRDDARDYAPVDTSQRYAPRPDERMTESAAMQSVIPQPPPPPRTLPRWLTFAGAGVLLLIVALFTVLYLLLPYPGFNLIVEGAPASSTVFVDNTARGVPASSGEIFVRGLGANAPRNVRVVNDGQIYYDSAVTGTDGNDLRITVNAPVPRPSPTADAGPPREITYGHSRMFFVPAGAFIMGDNNDPVARPAHEVNVADFYIDENEVTNAQYARFCQETNRQPPMNPFWSLNYFTQFPNAPVVGVTYADAEAYAQWAGKRLPTEEEWEKAASWDVNAPESARKRQWPWGNAFAQGGISLGTARAPLNVAQYPARAASPYGIKGMAGNVAEWVNAMFEPYAGNSASANPEFGRGLRVTRGGNFRLLRSELLRTTSRAANDPSSTTTTQSNNDGTAYLIGFRCAVSLDDERLQQHLRTTGNR